MILNWRTMPEVSTYMYTDFDPDMEKQRTWYKQIQADKSRYDWIINVDGEDVGLVSIVHVDLVHKRCEYGYYLVSPGVRGKGIGSSVEMNVLALVFDRLKLHKLCREVLVTNEVGLAFPQKFGSRVEGTRIAHIFKNGAFHDIVEMGILKEEYEHNVKGKFEFVKADFEMEKAVVASPATQGSGKPE